MTIPGRENKLKNVRSKPRSLHTLRLLAHGPSPIAPPVRFTAPARSDCPMPHLATVVKPPSV